MLKTLGKYSLPKVLTVFLGTQTLVRSILDQLNVISHKQLVRACKFTRPQQLFHQVYPKITLNTMGRVQKKLS